MPFPFDASSGFEGGTLTNCLTAPGGTASSCTSSGSRIKAAHFTELSRYGLAPYRGAYSLMATAAKDTTSQYIKELTLFDATAGASTTYTRMYFLLSPDFVMAVNDKFSLFESESVSDTTTQIAIGIQNAAGVCQLWWNLAQGTASPATTDLGSFTKGIGGALGKWYCLEWKAVVNAGAGTIDVWLDETALTQKASLTQGNQVDAKIGIIGPDAGTSGIVLIDDIIRDTTGQIHWDVPGQRFRHLNANVYFSDDHPILGAAEFTIGMTSTTQSGVLTCYDSDGVPPTGVNPFLVLSNAVATDFIPGHTIFQVDKGLYTTLTLAGTQAFISIEEGGFPSEGSIITYGRQTRAPRN
jgi:hypothetical protein